MSVRFGFRIRILAPACSAAAEAAHLSPSDMNLSQDQLRLLSLQQLVRRVANTGP